MIRLHLGCGSRLWEGFVNVDLADPARGLRPDVACDVRQLVFPDGYADEAHAIHLLEHFHEWEAEPLLLEWKRVLKPGGLLALELPCLDKVFGYIAGRYAAKEPLKAELTLWAFWGDPGWRSEAMTHKWGYTQGTLKALLERCGFEGVAFEAPKYHRPERDMRALARKPVTG